MPESPDDRVLMSHPTLPDNDPVDVSRRQLDLVYGPLGWVPAEDQDDAQAPAAEDAPADSPAEPTPPADAPPTAPATKRKAAAAASTTPDPATAATAAPDAPKGN